MNLKGALNCLQDYYKVILFYMVFAVAQFLFFWSLCHLMPGERLYQRKARIKAGKAPVAAVVDPIKKSQVPDWKR
jgi:hypothetical protein